jgi:hypothetical protein
MADYTVGDYVRIAAIRKGEPVEGELIAIVEAGAEMLLEHREATKNEPRVPTTWYRRYVLRTAQNRIYVAKMVARVARPELPEPPKPVAYRHIRTLRRMS